jgi:hypothetical protein
MRHRVSRGEEEALHVDPIDPVELVLRHVQHRLVAVRGAGVVHDDVEVAVFVERIADEPRHIGVARDVARTGPGTSAGGDDFVRHALRARGIDVVDDDRGALLRETLRDALAESRAATGDDGDAAVSFKPMVQV